MIQRLRTKRNSEEGFTLIELLIVIIVLGILAAIVVFAVGTTRDDAAESACNTEVKAVQLAAESVKVKTGAYAATEAGLVEGSPGGLLKAESATVNYVGTGGSPPTGYTITPVNPVGSCVALSG